MRPIGFSTGALAHSDFRRGLATMRNVACTAVEFSAPEQPALFSLLESLETLDLRGFEYISIHLPSEFELNWEALAWDRLQEEIWRNWPVVVHPETLFDLSLWRQFGRLLCIDNMDRRKPLGRVATELRSTFEQLPDATFCFDLGQARQSDPTMAGAHLILREFGPKLCQVHVSEVTQRGRCGPLSPASIRAFQEVAHLIPKHVPVIVETPVAAHQIEAEVAKAREAFPSSTRIMVA